MGSVVAHGHRRKKGFYGERDYGARQPVVGGSGDCIHGINSEGQVGGR